MEDINSSKIKEDISVLLKYIPKYGLFPCIDVYEITNEGIKLNNKLFDRFWVENLAAHLSNEGFVTQRLDLKLKEDWHYIEMTESGRKLKELGTIDAYNLWYSQEQTETKFRTRMAEYNYWVAVCIGLSTFVAAVYYYFQLHDGPISHKCEANITLGICTAALGTLILLRYLPRLLKRK